MRVVLSDRAISHATEAYRWYGERDASAADRFLASLQRALVMIGDYPLGSAADESGIRRRMLRNYPYALMYAVGDDVVTVLAVAHTSRRPGYWREP